MNLKLRDIRKMPFRWFSTKEWELVKKTRWAAMVHLEMQHIIGGRESAEITIEEFATGLSTSHTTIHRGLDILKKLNMITIELSSGGPTTYSIVDPYHGWYPPVPRVVPPRTTGGTGLNYIIDKTDKKDNIHDVNPKSLLIEYCKRFDKILNRAYVPSWGRDAKLLGGILATLSQEMIYSCMDRYFHDKDKFCQENGHSVPIFISRINRYLVQPTKAKEHPRMRN